MDEPESQKSIECQVCGDPLGSSGLVYCTACHTPHHEDCWNYNGKCSVFGCDEKVSTRNAEKYEESQVGDHVHINEAGDAKVGDAIISVNHPSGEVCGFDPNCTVDAKPADLTGGLSGPTASGQVFTGVYSRLDVHTPLEIVFEALPFVFLLFAFFNLPGKRHAANWHLVKLFSAIAIPFALVKFGVDCTYVIDNFEKRILYVRSLFGISRTWEVAPFRAVSAVGIETKVWKSKGRENKLFVVVLQLKGGPVFKVSKYYDSSLDAEDIAYALSSRIGVTDVRGRASYSELKSNWQSVPMTAVDFKFEDVHFFAPFSWVSLSAMMLSIFGLLLSLGH